MVFSCVRDAFILQAITLLLMAISLAWTPIAEKGYDRCLRGEERADSVVCWRHDALKRVEGLLLLAFLAEMAAKVQSVADAKPLYLIIVLPPATRLFLFFGGGRELFKSKWMIPHRSCKC